MLTVELGYTQEWQAPHNANSGSQYASFHRGDRVPSWPNQCLVWLVCCFKRDCPEKKHELDNQTMVVGFHDATCGEAVDITQASSLCQSVNSHLRCLQWEIPTTDCDHEFKNDQTTKQKTRLKSGQVIIIFHINELNDFEVSQICTNLTNRGPLFSNRSSSVSKKKMAIWGDNRRFSDKAI